MDYKELIKNRRSVRSYTDKKVPLATLHEMIQEACLAPSACNGQPWRFIIIQDKDLIKRLSDESKKNSLLAISKDPKSQLKQFEKLFKNPAFNLFYNAPSLILICGMKSPFVREDCSLAVSYLMFAATERKLATCWIALGSNIQDPKLCKEIGLTKDLEIIAPLIIGYPTAIPELPKRTSIILKQL